MSQVDDAFAKLLKRQPTDAERQHLYSVKDALQLENNDALWLVLIALQHYQTLYEQIPGAIDKLAVDTLRGFRITAEATAKAANESAKADLSKAVAEVAHQVATATARKDMWQWAGMAFALAALLVALVSYMLGVQFDKGFDAGKIEGAATGYQEAKDEKAAANWANTPEGQMAYKLARAGSLEKLASCGQPGWFIADGSCYVKPAPADGSIYGWALSPGTGEPKPISGKKGAR